MSFALVRAAATCLLAATTLLGCASAPKETWTNKGPSEIATERGQRACYADANIIGGERVFGMLCAAPINGLLTDSDPVIMAGPAYHRLFKVHLSETTKGINVPLGDKTGLLQCDPLGVFQGSCRVNRSTMPLFSPRAVPDPDSAAPLPRVPSFAFALTSVPGSSFVLVRTARGVAPGSDDPVFDAAQRA